MSYGDIFDTLRPRSTASLLQRARKRIIAFCVGNSVALRWDDYLGVVVGGKRVHIHDVEDTRGMEKGTVEGYERYACFQHLKICLLSFEDRLL